MLSKRITDKQFLALIEQFLKAGYVEDWRQHQTYSGVPQGGNLSPLLANIYLHELDQTMAKKSAEFHKGTDRKRTNEYQQISAKVARAKKKARKTGDWARYKALRKDMLKTQAKDPQDPDYRRAQFRPYACEALVRGVGR